MVYLLLDILLIKSFHYVYPYQTYIDPSLIRVSYQSLPTDIRISERLGHRPHGHRRHLDARELARAGPGVRGAARLPLRLRGATHGHPATR